MSGLFLFYLSCSLALIGVVALIARDNGRNFGIVCCLSAAAVLGAGCLLFSPGLIVQALLTLVLCAICGMAGASRKAAVGCALFAAGAGLFLAVSLDLGRVRETEKLRDEYPLVSLDDRLAYERRHTARLSDSPVLSTAVEAELAQRELIRRDTLRNSMLQRLHNRSRDQFEGITGVGAIRMRSMMHGGYLDLPDEPPVPQPAPEPQPYDPAEESPGELLAGDTESPGPDGQALVEMHNRGLSDFLDPNRMGYIDEQGRVAGFASHRLSQIPSFSRTERLPEEPSVRWEMTRLELVGLLMYEEPVAYVTEHLPRLEEMQKAATRGLDDFEKQALAELQTEKDVVTQVGPNEIRMLGALRAGNDCLECHNVPRGQLLGAFSYRLRPVERAADGLSPEVAVH